MPNLKFRGNYYTKDEFEIKVLEWYIKEKYKNYQKKDTG